MIVSVSVLEWHREVSMSQEVFDQIMKYAGLGVVAAIALIVVVVIAIRLFV